MALDAALGRLGIKPGVCTSSTRPANPFEGQVIYETDTNNIRFWSGSAWESNKGGIVSSSAPTGAAAGDIWYDSDDGRAYIYYDDGSSQQWVEFGAPPVQHGKILQVVSTTKTTTFTTASATKSAVTGFDVTITPSASLNKVLILVTGLVGHDTAGRAVDMDLERDGTPISQSGTSDTYAPIPEGGSAGLVISYLDSPATTSAVTYRLTMANGGAGNAYLNRYGSGIAATSTSTITAFEVSA